MEVEMMMDKEDKSDRKLEDKKMEIRHIVDFVKDQGTADKIYSMLSEMVGKLLLDGKESDVSVEDEDFHEAMKSLAKGDK